jgi:hypothetical protein
VIGVPIGDDLKATAVAALVTVLGLAMLQLMGVRSKRG